MATTNKKREQLSKLLEGIDIAMFTTLGEGGFPVSRPLSTQDAHLEGETLWFFVRRDTPKVREIGRNPKVNVSYASKDRNRYVSAAGVADIVDDQARIDQYWNDGMKAYFSRGRTDPQLVLIRVRVRTVQYWEGPSTGIGKLIAFVMARVTKSDKPLGENHLMRLDGKRGRSTGARRTAARETTGRAKAPRSGARKAATRKTAARKTATRKTATRTAAGTARAPRTAAGKTAARKPTARTSSRARR